MTAIRIPSQFFSSVTRRRRAAGSYVSGRWEQGALSDATITASVQPASGRDLLRLEEGLRTRNIVKVFTAGDLRTADERTGLVADRIVHDGEEYEVVAVDNFLETQMPHVEAMAVRVDRTGVA